MIFTLIGDPHAKPDNLDKINTLFDIVEDIGNEYNIWLGDLLDTKELIRGKCLNTYIERFKRSNFKHIVLIGNHDKFHVQAKEHSLEPLKLLKNVTVVDEPVVIFNEKLYFIPYTNNPEEIKPLLSPGDVVFTHLDVRNFDYGNGKISEEGLDPTDLKDCKRVISGHYHKYQNKGNITYLGTPFSHSFGESNQDKYLGIYDTEKDTLELIDSPFPRHCTVEVDCSKPTEDQYNEYDYWRVILKGTQEEIDKVKRVSNVKYVEEPSTDQSLIISETLAPEVQFEKWSREIKGYSSDIVNLGLEILRDV